MVAKKKTKKRMRTKASREKAKRKSSLLSALSRITGLSAKDIRTELTLLAKPSAKKPAKKTRRKKR